MKKFSILYFTCRNIEEDVVSSTIKIVKSYSFELCLELTNVQFENDANKIIIENYAFLNSGIETDEDQYIQLSKLDEYLQLKSNDKPLNYSTVINQIDTEIIQNMYSKFTFKCYKLIGQNGIQNLYHNPCTYLRQF